MAFKKGNKLRKGISSWNKGMKFDYKPNLKLRGRIPWNKNKNHPKYQEYIELVKRNDRLYNSGRISHRKGLTIEEEYGIEKAKELREKNRLGHLGQNAWNKDIKGYSTRLKGNKFPDSFREKLSIKKKEMFKQRLLPKFIGAERENNPMWKGGISFEPYTDDFNTRFKNAIRKRDNQICMNCGIHREKTYRSLDVHHINYDKKLSIQQNCISLCHNCHQRTNGNRTHWIKFFQSLLNEKYGYEYTENNEIELNIKSRSGLF